MYHTEHLSRGCFVWLHATAVGEIGIIHLASSVVGTLCKPLCVRGCNKRRLISYVPQTKLSIQLRVESLRFLHGNNRVCVCRSWVGSTMIKKTTLETKVRSHSRAASDTKDMTLITNLLWA